MLWVKKRSHPGFFIICLIFFWFFFIFLLLGSRFSDVRIFSGHMLQPGTFSDILGLSDILRTYVAARNVLGRSRTFGYSPDICCSPEHSRTFSDFRTFSGHMSHVGAFSDLLGLLAVVKKSFWKTFWKRHSNIQYNENG